MSWEKVKLGEITKNMDSKRKPLNQQEREKISVKKLYPYIGANNIMDYVDEYLFDEQIVCIAEDGGSWGENQNCCVYIENKCWVNNHAHVLGFNGDANLKYLMYYLNKADLNKYITGSTRGKLTKTALESIQIPLPPLHIQKQIANILDKADALRKKDQQLLQKYDELAQAIFIDMFGDPVKNEKGWEVKKLRESLNRIQIGPFGTQLHESDYVSDGIPLINPMHIGDLKIKPNYKYSIAKEKYEELSQYHLKEDDVILARRGEMGRCAIITELESGFICGTGSLFLTVSKKKLDPVFLVYLLSRNSTKLALEKSSAGTTMSNLNKTIIENFEIILPPVSEQQKFKNSILMNQHNIELVKKEIKDSEHLFQSLLQKAFTEELIHD